MKNKAFILIIILGITFKKGYTQNLVPNPSFEIYSTCPNSFSQTNKATPWYDPTDGSSDYFNACDPGFANVPFHSNGNGYQYARTGVAYTGLYALNGFGDFDREYIQVQLTVPLVYDSCYFVEFYCNLGDGMGYSINKMGAYLSDTAVHYTGGSPNSVLHYTPQVVSSTFLTDTLNWMHIAGYYHAIGGEKFLTIGDFKPFAPGDTLNMGTPGYPGAYYLIDDVSITKIPGCDTSAIGTGIQEHTNDLSFNLFPNPNNGNMTLDYTLASNEKAIIIIYDVTGKSITHYELNNASNKQEINASQLNNGIYFYSIIVNNKIVKQNKLIIIK